MYNVHTYNVDVCRSILGYAIVIPENYIIKYPV